MSATPNYETIGPIPQAGTFKYSGQIVDDSTPPVGIPAADLFTLTLTLKDAASGAVINGRTGQNVLNLNGVTVDSSGNLVWSAVAADNPIVTAGLLDGRVELHQAVFEWSWNGGARQAKRKVLIQVEVYTSVPG